MIQNFTRRHGNKLCTSGNLGDKIYIEHIADYVSTYSVENWSEEEFQIKCIQNFYY